MPSTVVGDHHFTKGARLETNLIVLDFYTGNQKTMRNMPSLIALVWLLCLVPIEVSKKTKGYCLLKKRV